MHEDDPGEQSRILTRMKKGLWLFVVFTGGGYLLTYLLFKRWFNKDV
ncbi:hypothetical protein PaeBR_03440 [Paenibacillus sp. BR2-3]